MEKEAIGSRTASAPTRRRQLENVVEAGMSTKAIVAWL